jgi:MoxR-like ATPase
MGRRIWEFGVREVGDWAVVTYAARCGEVGVDSGCQVRYNELKAGGKPMEPKAVQQFAETVIENVERVIVGKREAVELVMVALLCEGHVLIEDVPGTGKTMLARSVAASLGLTFKRLQCTPDLLPNDITGVSVFNQRSGEFEFRPGPAFVHVLLADEVNRATPRTQSALLESMGEGQVTVDGVTYPLTRPFLVMATQNPIEYEGTFPLPEAQLDRFLLKLSVGYPSLEEEGQILLNLQREHPITTIDQVVDGKRLLDMQRQVWEVHVDDTVRDYVVRLIHATRNHPDLALGASPRGSLALFKTAQALSALRGRDFVLPDDVKALAVPALVHRLIVRPDSALRGYTPDRVLNDILGSTALDIGTLE